MILVFDLDDTLYDESQFVRSGFASVSRFLAPALGVSEGNLFARMCLILEKQGRGRVFDAIMAEHNESGAPSVSKCVEVYRDHTPTIELTNEVRECLRILSKHFPMYLVTDGDPDVQKRKIAALRLDQYFNGFFPTWSYGLEAGKPSLSCFNMIRQIENVSWREITYVGDDPHKDFVSLRMVGARTVRIHTGRFANITAAPGFDAEIHISSFPEILEVLGVEVSHPLE